MLHLLPIRFLLTTIVAIVALATFGVAAVEGPNVEALTRVWQVAQWSGGGSITFIALIYASWRWVPPIQRRIFPYLGGTWTGTLQYSGPHGGGNRHVTLEITHTLFRIRLILNTDESTSRTLVVHPERDSEVKRYRLYYIYLNDRKEGIQVEGERYRGLAIMRVEPKAPSLHGEYFAEGNRSGTLELNVEIPHPWWRVWG